MLFVSTNGIINLLDRHIPKRSTSAVMIFEI